MNDYDLRFWERVFIAAVAAGRASITAKMEADLAVKYRQEAIKRGS